MTRFAIKIMNKYVSKEHNGNKVEQPIRPWTFRCAFQKEIYNFAVDLKNIY